MHTTPLYGRLKGGIINLMQGSFRHFAAYFVTIELLIVGHKVLDGSHDAARLYALDEWYGHLSC